MHKPLTRLIRSSALTMVLSLGLTAAAHGEEVRGCAILPPYESPDPPGFNSANGDIERKGGFYPYYSPLVPISVRWGYKHVVPYYTGYHPRGKHGAGRCPSAPGCGSALDNGLASGGTLEVPAGTSFDYGGFTGGAGKDANQFWRMGGNGLVPYGAPQSSRSRPDLIDLLQAGRGHP